MPVLLALGALLGWNLSRHLRGLSTLCSACRKVLPGPLFAACWLGLSAWLVPHYCRAHPLDRAIRALNRRHLKGVR